jgi:hypothetical protein
MTNGKMCEQHNIPEEICARCAGTKEERERIISLSYQMLRYYENLRSGLSEKSVLRTATDTRLKQIIEMIQLFRAPNIVAESTIERKTHNLEVRRSNTNHDDDSISAVIKEVNK